MSKPIAPECPPIVQTRVAQLSSLLALLYGGGFESFSGLAAQHQDHILWLAHDLASEIDAHVNGEGVNHE